jgi:hypothetical protein
MLHAANVVHCVQFAVLQPRGCEGCVKKGNGVDEVEIVDKDIYETS